MMFKVDKLSLISGCDINIKEYGVKIYQPNIKEIALIGEENFFLYLNLFAIEEDNFKKMLIKLLKENNKQEVEQLVNNFTTWDIFMFLLNSDKQFSNNCQFFLDWIIINKKVQIEKGDILLIDEESTIQVDDTLFIILKDIIHQIFLFNKFFSISLYEPVNEKARAIAEKMRKAKEKINKNNKLEEGSQSLFSNVISILSIGSSYSLNDLNNLTIYQLYNQFERYILYIQYNQSVQAALAGAKVDIVDWFKEI